MVYNCVYYCMLYVYIHVTYVPYLVEPLSFVVLLQAHQGAAEA
jgi:hypothetical protein